MHDIHRKELTVMPVHNINLELYRLERSRWSASAAALQAVERPIKVGLRVRLGHALITGGRLIAGPATVDTRINGHAQPASARR
jgi:hypothetical protein